MRFSVVLLTIAITMFVFRLIPARSLDRLLDKLLRWRCGEAGYHFRWQRCDCKKFVTAPELPAFFEDRIVGETRDPVEVEWDKRMSYRGTEYIELGFQTRCLLGRWHFYILSTGATSLTGRGYASEQGAYEAAVEQKLIEARVRRHERSSGGPV